MVYVRKTRGNYTRGTGRYKRTLYRKPSTTTNRNNVLALSKQVSKIQRQVTARKIYSMYNTGFAKLLQEPFSVITLTDPTLYTGVFDNAPTVAARARWKSVKFNLDMTLEAYEDKSIVSYTIFIVSLRSSSANTVLKECGNDLMSGTNGTGLASGNDYEVLSGKAFLNLKKFKLHYVKRATTGMRQTIDGVDMTSKNISDVTKRIYRKVKWPVLIRPGNSPGDFINIPGNELTDTSRLWVVAFNDAAVLTPARLDVNAMWTVSTV